MFAFSKGHDGHFFFCGLMAALFCFLLSAPVRAALRGGSGAKEKML